jgi:hypothetical protein
VRLAERIEKDPFLKQRFEMLKNAWGGGL